VSNKEKVLSTIQKLLNQAENTDFEEEAQAFLAHAERLMTKYDIEEALLAQAGKPISDSINKAQFWFDSNNYQGPRMRLVTGVARAHGLTDIIQLHPQYRDGKKQVAIEVFGYESDLEYLNMLVTSLFMQAGEAVHKPDVVAQMNAECYYPAHKVAWKNAFMLGFASKVASRLSDAVKEAKEEVIQEQTETTSQSVELALIDKSKLVTEAFKTEYPRTVQGRGSSAGSGGGSGSTFGHKAGQKANLGGKSVEGKRGALTA
tara:strand:- start:79 stop:858 length:780 start_codon:yes stop_codon:yes gene_type:complete